MGSRLLNKFWFLFCQLVFANVTSSSTIFVQPAVGAVWEATAACVGGRTVRKGITSQIPTARSGTSRSPPKWLSWLPRTGRGRMETSDSEFRLGLGGRSRSPSRPATETPAVKKHRWRCETRHATSILAGFLPRGLEGAGGY